MDNVRQLFHNYKHESKSANVYLTKQGFEVDLYINDTQVATRKVHNHSESYAEDVAENWCQDFINTIDLKEEELV
jgi:putative sterol carrier protein